MRAEQADAEREQELLGDIEVAAISSINLFGIKGRRRDSIMFFLFSTLAVLFFHRTMVVLRGR